MSQKDLETTMLFVLSSHIKKDNSDRKNRINRTLRDVAKALMFKDALISLDPFGSEGLTMPTTKQVNDLIEKTWSARDEQLDSLIGKAWSATGD